MDAFVLGNGTSRQSIDIDYLMTIGLVYGCNALYRTHAPHVLVATDKPIADSIQKSGYALKHTFFTRRPIPELGGKLVPQKYFGYSSGPIAMALAAQAKHDTIYMIGFDMGPSAAGRFNNMYADTEFYKKSENLPTFTGNWTKQMAAIAREFKNQSFIRVFGPTTADITEFNQLPNMQKLSLEDFVRRINKAKDL